MNCKLIRQMINKKLVALSTAALLVFSLTGCAAAATDSYVKDELVDMPAYGAAADNSSNGANILGVSVTYLNGTDMFTERDKEIGYDDNTATAIVLADNASTCNGKNVSINDNVVTITEEGTYLLSGALSNGQIVVDADDVDKIQIVLDGVDINCNTSAAIYMKEADKVFLTLASGSVNTLSTSGEFVAIDSNNIDSVIFAKSDLTLNGNGSLTIKSAYGHGIVSKDDLKITGGTYDITAASSALSGKDSVRIADGVFSLHTQKDGIHSENEEDEDKGFIYIAGGNFNMDCGSDGLDASSTLQIDGGNFSLYVEDDGFHANVDLIINDGNVIIHKCYEGLEGQTITINGGDISLTASDDGVNAANGNSQSGFEGKTFKNFEGVDGFSSATPKNFGGSEGFALPENFDGSSSVAPKNFGGSGDSASVGGNPFTAGSNCAIMINGGTLHITADGDGIDSNGNLAVTGGEIYVSGPVDNNNSALDCDGNALITGGIFVAAGSSGMAQNFGEDSTQGSMLVTLSPQASAGDAITLTDSIGKELLTYTPEKAYTCVVISCPQIIQGNSYTLTAGSQSQTIEMDSLIYGNGRFGGGHGFGGGHRGMDGNVPNFDGNIPDFDGNAPQFDGNVPDFDGNAPQFDGSRPDFNNDGSNRGRGNKQMPNGNAPQFNGDDNMGNGQIPDGNPPQFNGAGSGMGNGQMSGGNA